MQYITKIQHTWAMLCKKLVEKVISMVPDGLDQLKEENVASK